MGQMWSGLKTSFIESMEGTQPSLHNRKIIANRDGSVGPMSWYQEHFTEVP